MTKPQLATNNSLYFNNLLPISRLISEIGAARGKPQSSGPRFERISAVRMSPDPQRAMLRPLAAGPGGRSLYRGSADARADEGRLVP